MTSFSFGSVTELPIFAARLVGVAFVWTGIIKMMAPHTFSQHLAKLGWIPNRFLAAAVSAIAGFEGGLGVALFLMVGPRVVLPGTVALLAVLTAVSWWGVKSGKTTDCGCYGGYIQPSILQSVALNSAFASILLAAWRFAPIESVPQRWEIAAVAAAALCVAGVTQAAQWFEGRNGRYMFNTNPLRVGARWRNPWASSAVSLAETESIVAYLGPDCPYCRQWVRFLNAIDASPSLPPVVGVVGTSGENQRRFVEESGIRFPIVNISPSLMARLSPAVPTTVDVVGGKITEIWVGSMPPALYDRFKRAFFPEAASSPADPSAAP